MIRPTPKAVFLFALSVPIALVLVTLFRDFWYAALYLPCITLILALSDFTMTIPGQGLLAELDVPQRLYIGEKGKIRLSLRAAKALRPIPIEVLLETSGETDKADPVSETMRGGHLECFLAFVPLRRGQITIHALWLRWRGPLNFVEIYRRQPVSKVVDVLPDVRGAMEAALYFLDPNARYGNKIQQLKGEGTEFDSLRDYMQGMDNRHIDWKHSARHRKLLCKEFRQERNHQIVFGFDTGHLMLEPIDKIPKLDHAIRAGLSLAWNSLSHGDLVGGCGFDLRFRSFIKPGRGMGHFSSFQKFTADLSYHTEETNFTLGLAELNRRLQRRALIILFTEFIDTISAELLLESLVHMTKRHLVVFVTLRDPLLLRTQAAFPDSFSNIAEAVIANDFLRERAIVLERIARMGVHCLDTGAKELSSALLNKYLLIKQRGLL